MGAGAVGPAHRRWLLAGSALAILIALLAGIGLHEHTRRERLAQQLLASWPQDVTHDPQLVRFALAQARPLYQQHCAACHGANLRGNPSIGAADLVDQHWLWGNGSVFQIERIILYGIRSGESRALSVTDMPAFGLMGRLNAGQINELVQYLLKLNHRPYDAEAANAGDTLFHDDRYACYDCHGSDAHGNPDYGAPDLTVNKWNNGGDARSLYDSIYDGRHRIMPAWRNVLTLEQIRALAVYIHLAAQNSPALAQAPAAPRTQG